VITDAERERIQGLSLAAQWAELQAELPGLECRCQQGRFDEDFSICDSCNRHGLSVAHTLGSCDGCPRLDLALLLAAMSKAGYRGGVGISPKGFSSVFYRDYSDLDSERDQTVSAEKGAQ